MIKSVCTTIVGKRAVVGQSNVVRLSIALMLQKELAIVTSWDIFTKDLKRQTVKADILVSATGSLHLIKGEYIKAGTIVIDVGTMYIEDKSSKTGKIFVGDVEFETVAPKAGFITPVPGGVGPMTIAMLINNIVLAWKRSNFPHAEKLIQKIVNSLL